MANKESGQANLAEGQGGSTLTVAHAHAADERESRFNAFMKRGEEILDTFTQSIRGFEAQTIQIKRLAQEVNTLKGLPSRKRTEIEDEEGPTVKRKRVETVTSGSEYADSGDDIDQIMSPSETDPSFDNFSDPCIEDLSQFVVQEEKLGDDVKPEVARVLNTSLRSAADSTKLKSLLEIHKRPGNIPNLQVPRVDKLLWEQLNLPTKQQDVVVQKSISMISQALVPLIKAMDHVSGNKSPDLAVLKTAIGDGVKMMCDNIHKLNLSRREAIKKELVPKFKTLCSQDQEISATGLFGDNLIEQAKTMESSKFIKMTDKGNQKPFLSKRGGAAQTTEVKQQHRRPSYHNLTSARPTTYLNKFKRSGQHFRNTGKDNKGKQFPKRY